MWGEQVTAGVQRGHIVPDVCSKTKAQFDDQVLEMACGLHNFRAMLRYAPADEVLELLIPDNVSCTLASRSFAL
jgi:hypothetical protein